MQDEAVLRLACPLRLSVSATPRCQMDFRQLLYFTLSSSPECYWHKNVPKEYRVVQSPEGNLGYEADNADKLKVAPRSVDNTEAQNAPVGSTSLKSKIYSVPGAF